MLQILSEQLVAVVHCSQYYMQAVRRFSLSRYKSPEPIDANGGSNNISGKSSLHDVLTYAPTNKINVKSGKPTKQFKENRKKNHDSELRTITFLIFAVQATIAYNI